MFARASLSLFLFFIVVGFSLYPVSRDSGTQRTKPPDSDRSFGQIPLHFEKNVGQTDNRVKYLSRGSGFAMFLTGNSAVIAFNREGDKRAVEIAFAGTDRTPEIAAERELEGKTNYLTGTDRNGWRTGIENFGAIRYCGIYDGVDAVFYGNRREFEYDLLVAPNVPTDKIALEIDGADSLRINADGDLVIEIAGHELIQQRPIAFQEIDGSRTEVAANYRIGEDKLVTFEIADYNREMPLVIDPVLTYSTYWGGTLGSGAGNIGDRGEGIALDPNGNAYIVGTTTSDTFPLVGAYQASRTGGTSAFVAKINAAGNGFVYSTYLNGSAVSGGGNTYGSAIAVNSAGNAYVAGITQACNLPTTAGAFLPSGSPLCGGNFKGYVSKLNTAGSGLDFSTYIGDPNYFFDGEMRGIAVDSSGNAYVTGYCALSTFPTTGGAYHGAPPAGSGNDTFLIKLNSDASGLAYSTFLGGGNTSAADAFGLQSSIPTSLALDASNNAIITGYTTSTNFPVVNPVQASYVAVRDAFVTKVNSTGNSLVFSTYLGGSGRDGEPSSVATDTGGNVYVLTGTQSPNFPLTPTAFQPFFYGGNAETALTKIGPNGTLIYSTFLGFEDVNIGSGNSVAVDSAGNPYVTGNGLNGIFPVTPLTLATTPVSTNYVAKFNSTATGMIYGTFFNGGAAGSSLISDLAIDSGGNAFLTGLTTQSAFPTTGGAPQSTNQDTTLGNAFISKISLTGSDCPPIVIDPQPLSVAVRNQPYNQQLSASGGSAPYTFSLFPGVAGNAFPAGITVSGSGLISGTYTGVPQISKVAVRAVDANGCVGVRPYRMFYFDGVRPYDFDGDMKADVALFRPSTGVWYRLDSFRNIPFSAVQFGANGDIPAAGDFDGDGLTDISIFRPSDGNWWRINSLTGTITVTNFGLSGDVPAVGDFDGDGKSDIAVFRPSAGDWYLLQSQNGLSTAHFGLNGDRPVVGDYDGDGRADRCVFRPSSGDWYVWKSSDSTFFSSHFGSTGDVPVRGDFDGGGKSDLAVFRPSDGNWYFLSSETQQFSVTHFGLTGDVPAPSDYDGDSATDICVFRPSTGVWYRLNSSNSAFAALQFGLNGDIPIASLP